MIREVLVSSQSVKTIGVKKARRDYLMRKLNLNRRECNKIINFIIKRMLRNRNKDIKEDQCFPQSKPQKLP